MLLEPREQRFDRVEDDAPGADRLQGVVEADEQAFEIVLPRLLDLRALDPDVFQRQALAPDERREVVAERRDILHDVVLGLLEGHEDAALAVRRAVHEELQAEQRLAAAGPAADERRAAARQSASGDLVETADAGDDFFEDWPWKCRSSAGCFLTRAAGRHRTLNNSASTTAPGHSGLALKLDR